MPHALADSTDGRVVIAGGAVSVPIRGGVLAPNDLVRSSVVTGGVLAVFLFLLLLHVAGDVVQLHRHGRPPSDAADL